MDEGTITRLDKQLALTEITETVARGGIHYLIGCYKAPTGFWSISCSCGWRTDTSKSAGGAYALLRAHYRGHEAAEISATDAG